MGKNNNLFNVVIVFVMIYSAHDMQPFNHHASFNLFITYQVYKIY